MRLHKSSNRGLRKHWRRQPLGRLPFQPHHHFKPKSSVPITYLRLKERIAARSHALHRTTTTSSSVGNNNHTPQSIFTVSSERPRVHGLSSTPSLVLPNQAYRIRRPGHTSIKKRSSSTSAGGSTTVAASRTHNFGSPPTKSDFESVSGSDSDFFSSSSTSHSPSSPPSPTSSSAMPTDPDHHHELMMLKREAFQELASQTQRFDDLFIAKMIYWESLGNEEKAQWLERGHHHHRHTPSNHLQSHEQQSCQDMEEEVESSMEQDEIDDLVNALECRATCKDYSALLDFEREAAAERRRQTVGERDQLHDTSAVKMQDPLTCWDLGYEDVF